MTLKPPQSRRLVDPDSEIIRRSHEEAIRELQKLSRQLRIDLDGVDASGGSGGGVPTTRLINTTAPLSGGGDLSADRTLVVADNSITSSGVVALAPNDITKFWRGDATWSVPPGAPSVTPSVVLAITTLPASRNLSTVGTLDWMWITAVSTQTTSLTNPTLQPAARFKIKGGWLWTSYSFFGPTPTINAYNSGVALSTTALDDSYGVALSDGAGAGNYYTGLGSGFKFRMPASTTQRICKLFIQATGGTVTYTAILDNAARTTSTTTLSSAAGVTTQRELTITYTSDVPCDLCFTAQSTTNVSSVSCGFASITLA